MKKIKDERLILKNFKNIRIAYIVQTLGIIAILGYDLITKDLDGMTENPLWLVLMITTVTYLYLTMSISVDHENDAKSPKRGLNISVLVLIIICSLIGVFVSISDGSNVLDGIIMGGILFVCGLVAVIYTYFLRKRRSEDSDI